MATMQLLTWSSTWFKVLKRMQLQYVYISVAHKARQLPNKLYFSFSLVLNNDVLDTYEILYGDRS
jgi:hypothetical protein